MAKFSQHIADLAATLKEGITTQVVGDNLVMSHGDDVYTKHLPEGITPDIATKVHNHDIDMTMALTYAAGQVAIDNFTTNQDLKSAEYNAKLGANKLEVNYDRTKTYQVPSKDSGETTAVVRDCNTTVKFIARAGRNSDLGAIRASLVDMANEAYGSK